MIAPRSQTRGPCTSCDTRGRFVCDMWHVMWHTAGDAFGEFSKNNFYAI